MQLHDTNWKFTPSLRQPFDFQFNVFLGYFSRVFLCLLDSFEPHSPATKIGGWRQNASQTGKRGGVSGERNRKKTELESPLKFCGAFTKKNVFAQKPTSVVRQSKVHAESNGIILYSILMNILTFYKNIAVKIARFCNIEYSNYNH